MPGLNRREEVGFEVYGGVDSAKKVEEGVEVWFMIGAGRIGEMSATSLKGVVSLVRQVEESRPRASAV